MKKIILLFISCLFAGITFGQHINIHYVKLPNGEYRAMHGNDSITIDPEYARRADLTITTDGGIIRFFENGEELKVMAYSPLYETNYYVKTGGDDTKSGLTDADAWAHHPWMSTWTGSTVLVAGDVVNMKRGDTWTKSGATAPYMEVGQSGTAGKPITTTAYGTGNKPIIKIATDNDHPVIRGQGVSYITLDNLDIQHFEATRDVGNSQDGIIFDKDAGLNVPHDWIITNCDVHNCPKVGIYGNDDSYNITIGNINAVSTATTTAYSNHIYNCGYGAIILAGRDPATDHSHFNVFYNYINDINTAAGATEDTYGIAVTSYTQGTAQQESDGWPAYATARFNRIDNNKAWAGMDCHGGTYIYYQDNYIKDCYIGMDVFAADRPGYEAAILDYCYVERNTIENTGAAISGSHTFMYVEGEDAALRNTHCYITDNILFYTTRPATETSAKGIVATYTDGVVIDGNHIYNGPTGASDGAIHINPYSKNVKINANYICNWSNGIYFEDTDIDGDLAITDNIIYSNREVIRGVFNGGTIISGDDITILNNTLLTTTTTASDDAMKFYHLVLAGGSTLVIENNIIGFITATTTGIYIEAPSTITGTFTSENNLYWHSTYATPYFRDDASHTWATWNAHGHDDAGLNNTDPLFTNGSTTYSLVTDFNLTDASPAIDEGTNTGVTLDYYGNARVGNYDIGAVEKQ
jgi:hypothetical protein